MQMTFGTYEDQNRRKKETVLDTINELIDFRKIEQLLHTMYSSTPLGKPEIPPLILFKALLLESWYKLSDGDVVEEIHDRRSFERFVGEHVRNYYLDDTTLVVFRKRIRDHHLEQKLWELVGVGLEKAGLQIKNGVIIDATLVKGAARHGSKRKDGKPVDEDVHCTVRKDTPLDGYKVHVTTDTNQLIRKMEISHIEEHDHNYFERMLPKGADVAYADKAYCSRDNDHLLKKKGVRNRILRKGYRNHPLTKRAQERNRRWSKTRSSIERKMNDLKRWCGMERMRYIGLERNRLWVLICGMAANLKRMTRLMEYA
jgi:IS5 family transposase